LNVITDRKLPINNPENNKVDYYTADVVAYNDYMPFGALMEGRHGYDGKKTNYGFQGQEMDDEIKGEGNSYTTEFRQYDTRLGRWLSLDPLAMKYADISPYASYINNPILFEDKNGDSIRVSKAIYESTMNALTVLNKTEIGKKLLNYYQPNQKEHVNVYAYDVYKGEEKARSWAITITSNHVKIDDIGQVKISGYENSKNDEDYINSSGFNFKGGGKNHFVGRNFTENLNSKLDKYDLAFIMFHEISAHIKNTTGDADKDHDKFGSSAAGTGMKLWTYNEWEEKYETIVKYGTDSWTVFKEILKAKVNDGNGTGQNKEDLKYMEDYEKSQEEKK
jgi:RHS repeat-associated protein